MLGAVKEALEKCEGIIRDQQSQVRGLVSSGKVFTALDHLPELLDAAEKRSLISSGRRELEEAREMLQSGLDEVAAIKAATELLCKYERIKEEFVKNELKSPAKMFGPQSPR